MNAANKFVTAASRPLAKASSFSSSTILGPYIVSDGLLMI